MKYTYFLLSLMLPVLFMQCHSHKNITTNSNQTVNVNYKIIVKSALHGNGAENIQPGHYIIKDKTSWKKLLSKMDKVNHESQKISEIDFDKNMVVAVFDPVLGAGGVSLKVNKIEETNDAIFIRIGHKKPNGQLAIQVMNQPYIIIELPKTDKKIVIETKK